MSRSVTSNPTKRRAARLTVLAITVVVALGALIGSAAAGQKRGGADSTTGKAPSVTKTVAKKANNATLGKVVLTSLKNRTLYTLSSEVHGKLYCTGGCLSIWPPLIVGKNVKPHGPAPLNRTRLPDGRFQVTFRGRPLYTYGGDSKAGDANGEGLMLGSGTWHAASLGKISAPESPPESPNPYPY